MKISYYIFGITIAIGIIIYFTSCNNKSANNEKGGNEIDSVKPKVHQTQENTFPELRKVAFAVTPGALGLSLPEDKTVVYGVIMDWEMDGATATTVSYMTGDASLYLSSGGGVIGGGQHENVSKAAKDFVNEAQNYIDKCRETKQMDLPNQNEIQFFLLTNKGVLLGKEKIENFENNSSKWLGLFNSGNMVLSQLRIVSEK